MSATSATVAGVHATRDDWDRRLTAAGHAMDWRLGANAHRRGHAYFLDARCRNCGAEMSVGEGSTSGGVRDARHVPCSGPRTAVCTEVEQTLVAAQISAAAAVFLQETR